MELEEELKVVGNSLKSLEVSEEKVISSIFIIFQTMYDYAYSHMQIYNIIRMNIKC